jgi:hypothetical protein
MLVTFTVLEGKSDCSFGIAKEKKNACKFIGIVHISWESELYSIA